MNTLGDFPYQHYLLGDSLDNVIILFFFWCLQKPICLIVNLLFPELSSLWTMLSFKTLEMFYCVLLVFSLSKSMRNTSFIINDIKSISSDVIDVFSNLPFFHVICQVDKTKCELENMRNSKILISYSWILKFE